MPAVSHRGKGRRTVNEINMVPFIDVMLVLLIIFMVTAPLITPSTIDLPTVGQAARQPDRFVQVLVDKNGGLSLKDSRSQDSAREIGKTELASQVKSLQGAEENAAHVPVVISADRQVKYESVVEVMDTLKQAGIERVGLSVQSTR